MRNTGKPAEAHFERAMAAYGKRAVVHRLQDSAALTAMKAARTGKSFGASLTLASEQPADYVVCENQQMYYAEVKSISQPKFPFSALRRKQVEMGMMATTACDNSYMVFVRHEPTRKWWKIPYERIEQWAREGKKGVQLSELHSDYEWSAGNAIH